MEKQAKCPYCGKITTTINNQKQWQKGCSHADGVHGLGRTEQPADNIIIFQFSQNIWQEVIGVDMPNN